MLGYEIAQILSKDKLLYKNFTGLKTVENIPKRLKKHHFVVINHLLHWLVLHRTIHGSYEVFDSLGVSSDKLSRFENLKTIQPLFYNTSRLQDLNSKTCGHFCIFYITNRFYNNDLSYDEFMNLFFEESEKTNEKRVRKFIRKV